MVKRTFVDGVVAVALCCAVIAVWSPQSVRANHNAGSCNSIFGTSNGEEILGDNSCNDLWARAGNDTVRARDGQDDAHGEEGGDFVEGEADHDYVFGGPGDDSVLGRYGNDHVQDESGSGGGTTETDAACGNEGVDFVDVKDGDASDHWYNPNNSDTGNRDAATEELNLSCPH